MFFIWPLQVSSHSLTDSSMVKPFAAKLGQVHRIPGFPGYARRYDLYGWARSRKDFVKKELFLCTGRGAMEFSSIEK